MPENRFETVRDDLFRAGNKISEPSAFSTPDVMPALGLKRRPRWSTAGFHDGTHYQVMLAGSRLRCPRASFQR